VGGLTARKDGPRGQTNRRDGNHRQQCSTEKQGGGTEDTEGVHSPPTPPMDFSARSNPMSGEKSAPEPPITLPPDPPASHASDTVPACPVATSDVSHGATPCPVTRLPPPPLRGRDGVGGSRGTIDWKNGPREQSNRQEWEPSPAMQHGGAGRRHKGHGGFPFAPPPMDFSARSNPMSGEKSAPEPPVTPPPRSYQPRTRLPAAQCAIQDIQPRMKEMNTDSDGGRIAQHLCSSPSSVANRLHPHGAFLDGSPPLTQREIHPSPTPRVLRPVMLRIPPAHILPRVRPGPFPEPG